jgi:pyridoxal phosphate enzyme (YggS family)
VDCHFRPQSEAFEHGYWGKIAPHGYGHANANSMITDNLKFIKSNFGKHTPALIAVSKQQPDDKIDEALDRGIRVFGENKVQEAQTRWTQRKNQYSDLELHLIGPLQTNKVKQAVELFDVFHALDREKLAKEIVKYKVDWPCFIQVNTGDEDQKSGLSLNNSNDFYHYCRDDLGMNIIGLMCIPPIDEPAGLHFGLLAEKAKTLNLKGLSMGMSNDYALAIQYGATHIRVGSALFGERPT